MQGKILIASFIALFVLIFPGLDAGAENEYVEKKIVLQREYLDGELSEEKVTEHFESIEEFKKKYYAWSIIEVTENEIILHKYEDDISPLLKANGYLGITEKGVLSIYNGKPQYQKIIQSFYQIDVGKLEVYKQEELHAGIPIVSKEQYKSLLKEFEPYSID